MPEHTKAESEHPEAKARTYETELKEWLDFALAHKDEPEKIAEKVKATERQRNGRESPSLLHGRLIDLAGLINLKADSKDHEAEIIDPKPPRKEGVWLPPPSPRYQEGAELRKSAQELRNLAQELEAAGQEEMDRRRLEGREADDDPSATPRTLFAWRRVEWFLRKLPDDQARYAYLQKLKAAYLNKDPRAAVGKFQHFHEDKDFNKKIEDKITLYEKILNKSVNVEHSPPQAQKARDATTRRQVFAALLLLFGRLEVPADITQSHVAEFVHFLTGKNLQNIRVLFQPKIQAANSQKSGYVTTSILCAICSENSATPRQSLRL